MDSHWIRICAFTLATVFLQDITALNLRNELLGKCVQVQDGEDNEKVTLEECKAGSAFQEWQWSPETRSLRNPQTGKCLTALKIQERGTVGLLACGAEDDKTQAWSCSKKGHLTLYGKGFHLSVHQESSDVCLSTERGKRAKWRTLNEKMVCEEPPNEPKKIEKQIIAKIRLWQPQVNQDLNTPKPTQPSDSSTAFPKSNRTEDDGGPGTFVNFLSMEYGEWPGHYVILVVENVSWYADITLDTVALDTSQRLAVLVSDAPARRAPTICPLLNSGMEWKVTMLVLSSLALVIGVVILFLNVYQNRRKKTVVVLKSYTSTSEASQPGSPVSSERASLTKHPMKPPRSPSIQRGEILVEWKDGTVTPLFDTYQTS